MTEFGFPTADSRDTVAPVMPVIDTKRRKQPAIGELRSNCVVCTWMERPDDDISVVLSRPGVYRCMARILPIRGSTVMDYQTVWGEGAPTHEITLRVPPDVQLALNHWIYDDGAVTKTWYRVRNIEDLGGVRRFLIVLCTVDTFDDVRSDPATQQREPDFEQPRNVVPFP